MEIIVAKSSGFCFGVSRAIEFVYNRIGKGKTYTLGPLIHNKTVTDELKSKGVFSIESLDEVKDGTVIIRSHGVGESIYNDIKSRNIDYIDGTCPYVKKIQNIVYNSHKLGNKIIIVGNKVHPEVVGINGWCENEAIIIDEPVLDSSLFDTNSRYTVVVQTTFRQEKYDSILLSLKRLGLNILENNTICLATEKRQRDAYELSKKVDKMLVIGDKGSSNTQKLYEICKKNCEFTYYIETIEDLVLNIFSTNDKIGITAGASTPSALIKEVISTMYENEQKAVVDNVEEELSFQDLLDQTLVSIHTGDVVTGTVISITGEEVNVNLGYKSDGIIPRGEYSSNPDAIPSKELKAGDEIEVFVCRVNDGDGNVLLSRKRLEAQKGMDEVQNAFENGTPITGRVTEVVKGGVIAVANGVRVFIPSSQVSNKYIEDLSVFKGTTLSFNIIEFDKGKRRIIGGRKALIEKEINEKRQAVFDKITVGEKITGTVSRLADFGAFVDLGGVDGLIHISEMSWGRVTNPREVLSEGQTVSAVVLEFDREKGKISLSLKDVDSNPWNLVPEKYAVGNIVSGKVVRIVPFGAFVELEPGIDGLVHISQISEEHVKRAEDVLTIGEEITVKVIELDVEQKKISLSKKQAEAKEEAVDKPSEIIEAQVDAAIEKQNALEEALVNIDSDK